MTALTEVEAAYRRSLPAGEIGEQDLTVLDRTGVPTVAMGWSGGEAGAGGTGYGATLEAARVDGATRWQTFWQITFPLMLPVSATALILKIIFELKLADIERLFGRR